MTRIPVLMLSNGMNLGGVEKTVIAFAKEFDPHRFEVHIGCFLTEGVRTKEAKETGLPYIFFNGNEDQLHTYLLDHDITVLHSHEQGIHTDAVLRAASNTAVQCMIQINVFSLANASDTQFDRQLFISTTNLLKYNWLNNLPFDIQKRGVLYNPINLTKLDTYTIDFPKRTAFRSELGIGEEHIVLGKIARKTLGKWSDLNLDILPSLLKLHQNVRFLVLGLPDSRWRLARRMKVDHAIIRVEETTDVERLAHYYQAMDILVHFSKIGECCSAAIQEAMAFKLPIITNSTPFSRSHYRYVDNGQIEQVSPGVNGFIANSPRSIVAAISELCTQPEKRQSFGTASRKLLDSCALPRLTRQLEKTTLEILAEKGDEEVKPILRKDYAKIAYRPTEEEILTYISDYPRLAATDYLAPTMRDRFSELYRLKIRNKIRAIRDQLAIRSGQEA